MESLLPNLLHHINVKSAMITLIAGLVVVNLVVAINNKIKIS